MIPILSLHGTSKGVLMQQYSNVIAALREAEAAINAAEPNARDYQKASDLEFHTKAQKEHYTRLLGIELVRKSYERDRLALDKGQDND